MRDAAGAATPELGLRRIVRAAVAHQMSRPRLALLLDGRRAGSSSPTAWMRSPGRSRALLALLGRLEPAPPVEAQVAAGDLFALLRGMVDAAGERGERAGDALEQRVLRAVFGYLGLPPAAP